MFLIFSFINALLPKFKTDNFFYPFYWWCVCKSLSYDRDVAQKYLSWYSKKFDLTFEIFEFEIRIIDYYKFMQIWNCEYLIHYSTNEYLFVFVFNHTSLPPDSLCGLRTAKKQQNYKLSSNLANLEGFFLYFSAHKSFI